MTWNPSIPAAFCVAFGSLGTLLPLAGAGFGYLELEAPPVDFAITPIGGSQVQVAWIEQGASENAIRVEAYRDGFAPGAPLREIFSTTRPIRSLKLERDEAGRYFLCLTDGVEGSYLTRLLRYDADFVEEDRIEWTSFGAAPAPGRMLNAGMLLLGVNELAATGRFIETDPLRSRLPFTIQNYGVYDPQPDSPYNEVQKIPVAGLDTAITDEGAVDAVYILGWLKFRRFSSVPLGQKFLILDAPPLSPHYKTGRCAISVNASRTSLLAWEWHEYGFDGVQLVNHRSTPAFRAIRPNGTKTGTVFLEPWSTSSDLNDRPAVALRDDGSAVIAWTVRTESGVAVWLQRLDTDLNPYEAPRRVDGRPGVVCERPTIKAGPDGGLFLAWRCTPVAGGGAQIGLLELSQLDRALAMPVVTVEDGMVRIDWKNPPATRSTLWHAPDLTGASAHPMGSEVSLPGAACIEHEKSDKAGFYWVESE
ncbi:MAG: hypothetical protein AAGI48_16020 [Verrucomicrobiota bacterium]